MPVVFEKAPPLPDWLSAAFPVERRAARVEGELIHFVDHGKGPAVVLIHGNPTWSFIWRKVIARLEGEARIIAPDVLGFGLSDKPLRTSAHSLDHSIRLLGKLVDALELPEVTLVGQDWGGPLAAGIGARSHTPVHGLVFANTAVLRPARPFRPKLFHRFAQLPLASDLAFRALNFPVPVLDRLQGDRASIGPLEKRAYAWPFRRPWHRAAPLAYARLVPNNETHTAVPTLDESGAWVESFAGPIALVWGKRDPILGRTLKRHVEALPHAFVYESEAGHFLQEEVPDLVAGAIRAVLAAPGAPSK